jgi:hypothetical protein
MKFVLRKSLHIFRVVYFVTEQSDETFAPKLFLKVADTD